MALQTSDIRYPIALKLLRGMHTGKSPLKVILVNALTSTCHRVTLHLGYITPIFSPCRSGDTVRFYMPVVVHDHLFAQLLSPKRTLSSTFLNLLGL